MQEFTDLFGPLNPIFKGCIPLTDDIEEVDLFDLIFKEGLIPDCVWISVFGHQNVINFSMRLSDLQRLLSYILSMKQGGEFQYSQRESGVGLIYNQKRMDWTFLGFNSCDDSGKLVFILHYSNILI